MSPFYSALPSFTPLHSTAINMSYLSSLNNLLTTTTSRYASLRRNILSSSSEDDTVSAALLFNQPCTNRSFPFVNPPLLPHLNDSGLNRTGHHRPGILPRLPSSPSLLHRKKPPLPRLAGRRSPRGSARATTCTTTTVCNE